MDHYSVYCAKTLAPPENDELWSHRPAGVMPAGTSNTTTVDRLSPGLSSVKSTSSDSVMFAPKLLSNLRFRSSNR